MKKLCRIVFAAVIAFLLFHIPAKAASTSYVEDNYGLLSQEEISQLNEMAAQVSEAHKVGVYIRIYNDFSGFLDIESFAEDAYLREGLGYGDTNDGIMLVLTMEDRSFDIFATKGTAETAFGQLAREEMADRIVYEYLRYDRYFDGFKNYIAIADEDLNYYDAGTPVSYDFDPYGDAIREQERKESEAATRTAKTAATAGIPFITSLLTVLGLKSRNKTAGIKHEADDYIPKNGIRLYTSSDIYLYKTESRTKIHHDEGRSGGGGGFHSSSSGGGGHTSGHF